MFSIYIKNYLDPSVAHSGNIDGASLIETETKMYDIPSEYASDNMLLEPKISTEMGKAGSFEFKIEPNHPYFNSFRQMKTIMRITYEDHTLFRGRVLTIDNTMYGERSVHLEGDLAFLLDTYHEAVKDEDQVRKSLETYLTEVISYHNQLVESDKKFVKGEVPGNYSGGIPQNMRVIVDTSIDNPTKKYDTNSWTQSMNALDSLSSQYGGYWRTGYVNGHATLDWFRNYFNPVENPQVMRIGSNLINISNTLEVNNLFTAIIPIGIRKGKALYLTEKTGKKYMAVPDIVNEYTSAELSTIFHSPGEYASAVNNYGWIYKTVQFSNAEDTETLFKYAKDWIKNNYHGGITSFTISAIDLHMTGEDIRPYLVGDLVRVIYPNPSGGNDIEGVYAILKASYDLYNPENNQYTVGIPDMALSKTYGETKTTKSSSSASKSPTNKQSDTNGDMSGLIDNLSDDSEASSWDNLFKVWRYFDTGEIPDDDGESKANDLTTTNDDMDDDDKDSIWSMLRADGFKSKLFDAVKGNFNNILTVGGNNTVNALMHMAGSETGGTWSDTSPIILDGTTGDIISKKGHAVFQTIDIGTKENIGTGHNQFWVDALGKLRCTDLSAHGDADFYGGINLRGAGSNIVAEGRDAQNASILLTAFGTIRVGNAKADHYYVKCQDDVSNATDIATYAFTDVAASESDGVITFNFWGPKQTQSNTPIKSVNFNMADTQFYKDAVEAAKEEGRQEGGDVDISITADKDNSYTEKGSDYTQIFTDVTFTNQKWYRFTVKAGTKSKGYAIYVKTS